MKVALPIWQNRVAPLFDECNTVKIFKIDQQWKLINTVNVHSFPLVARLKAIDAFKVDAIVCNGISLFLKGCLQARSIQVLNDRFGEETEILKKIKIDLTGTKNKKLKEENPWPNQDVPF